MSWSKKGLNYIVTSDEKTVFNFDGSERELPLMTQEEAVEYLTSRGFAGFEIDVVETVEIEESPVSVKKVARKAKKASE